MKTVLIFFLSLLFAFSAAGQGKRFTEEHKTRQLLEMQEGVLLVPLFRAPFNGGIHTTTQSSEKTLRAEHNSQIIRAFETNYPFGEVLYFYSDNWLEIKKGNRKGLILNSNMETVSEEAWHDKTFFMASFEPSGWHLPPDIDYKKKSIEELGLGESAYLKNLPLVVAEETALAIPLFRVVESTQNAHELLLKERLNAKNKTIVSELNACEKDYPVYFFHENLWAQIEDGKIDDALFNCSFSESTTNVDPDELTIFRPAFCPIPQKYHNSSAFDKEMAIMNPNSNYFSAVIIERLYDKAHAKNSRRTFLINFRYAYRLNFSSGVKGSYASAVEGIVGKITTDLNTMGLLPTASEEQ